MIVYSANIGRKDRFHQPKMKHDGVEYVYFVHDINDPLFENHENSIWDVREIPRRTGDTLMDSKWYKMHPHLLFPGEDTVWCDSLYIPRWNSPLSTLKLGVDVVAYEHSVRHCLFKEAAFCLERNVGNAADIKAQIAEYRKQGMPEDFGLWEGNVIYRKPEAASFSESWWDEVSTRSTRDQLSLPYVLWRDDVSFMGLPDTAKTRRFFKGGKHIFHGTREY